MFRQVDVDSYLEALPAFFPPPPRTDAGAAEGDEAKAGDGQGAEKEAREGAEPLEEEEEGDGAQAEEERRE